MREGEIISSFFAPLAADAAESFHLRDDAAALAPPAGARLIVTTDSVIEGVHVPPQATASQAAVRLMRRNLSDLAAMGAAPWRYLLNLHLGACCDAAWLAEFCAALEQEQARFGVRLAGGDTTRGSAHFHLSMTCLGLMRHPPLLRSGAKPGDDLYVSGTLGDAALALAYLDTPAPNAAQQWLLGRYWRPEPRLALGEALHGIAHAAMDISDGLLLDLERLCMASGVGACVERAAIPLSPAARAEAARDDYWENIISGGDDYELLFAAPPNTAAQLTALPTPVKKIGCILPGQGVTLVDAQGKTITPPRRGWEY